MTRRLLIAGLYVAAALHAGGAATSAPGLDIGDRKQLLIDEMLVASSTGFALTLHSATAHHEPVLLADRPWEARRLSTGQSVLEHEGAYKMWYTALSAEGDWYLCYATSKDAMHWTKPSLGLIEYQGSKDNNIVFAGSDRTNYAGQFSVFEDPTDPGPRRFKLVYGSTPKRAGDAAGLPDVVTYDYSEAIWKKTQHFISAAFSPDGLRWTPSKQLRMVDWYTDTQDVAYWDDRIRKYVLFVRWNHERWNRSIGRSESADFERFPPPSLILTPDELDPEVTGLYNSAAMKYPYADNAYFMFPSAFFHIEGGKGGSIDGSEIQLATSRDGVRFRRPWRRAFLGIGPEGRFDASQVYMGTGMLRIKDDLLLYFTGYQPSHKQMEAPPPRTGGIGVTRVRLDGFVSQIAPPTGGARAAGGTLTTVPVIFSGSRLEINMNAGAGGWLKVEILDRHSQPVPAFSGANADELLGNSVRRTATWSGKPDISGLRGQPVQLRFIGRDVQIYAFQFPK
jgi:hypothetical protein